MSCLRYDIECHLYANYTVIRKALNYMKIIDYYYSDADLPLNNKERREIRRSAWKLWMQSWRNKLIYVILYFTLTGLAAAIGWLANNVWQLSILLILFVGLWELTFYTLRRVCIAPISRRLIRQRGIDVNI